MYSVKIIPTLQSVMAYLDPGSGSLFIQLLLASLAGMGFYFLSKIKKIKDIFRKKSSVNNEDEIEEDLFDE